MQESARITAKKKKLEETQKKFLETFLREISMQIPEKILNESLKGVMRQ